MKIWFSKSRKLNRERAQERKSQRSELIMHEVKMELSCSSVSFDVVRARIFMVNMLVYVERFTFFPARGGMRATHRDNIASSKRLQASSRSASRKRWLKSQEEVVQTSAGELFRTCTRTKKIPKSKCCKTFSLRLFTAAVEVCAWLALLLAGTGGKKYFTCIINSWRC